MVQKFLYADLANQCLKPLSHSSKKIKLVVTKIVDSLKLIRECSLREHSLIDNFLLN